MRPRKAGELYAFVIPPSDHFGSLLTLLERGGVEIDFPGTFTVNRRRYPQNTAVVRVGQPYGSFAKALLETQRYPDLRDASGHPIPPYDVTAHTLPLLMGVQVHPIYARFRLPRPKREKAAGSGGGCGGASDRRAIYRSHSPSMDEGWTRWVLENQSRCLHHVPVYDADLKKGNLHPRRGIIIIPDQAPRTILNGYRSGMMPPELTGGLANEGVKALREFVEQGGTLVCLNRASEFAVEQFKLPLRNIVAGVPRTEFYVPGSILRIELDTSHPLAKDMPKESIAWAEDSPVFEVVSGGEQTSVPASNVRIIARYPSNSSPLLSGWLLGGDRIKGKAALVEVTMGKGRIILFGFRPQYRAQSLATYPLFFNAIGR